MRFLFLATFAAGLLFAVGCKTNDDPENVSVRPWNAPKGWESGMPSGMTEGR